MSGTTYILSDDALADAEQITAWYELQSAGLGKRFIIHILSAFEKIAFSPLAFSKVTHRKHIRKLSMKSFPYRIYFTTDKSPVEIIAIIHNSRSPKLIQQRLK